MTRFTKRFLPCVRYHLRTKSSFWNLKEAFGRLLSSWFVLKSGPTPTNPVDEDVISKPSVILNWSYEGIMYNQPITSEHPIAPQNTRGSISISANGSYKRKIPRISMICHINWYVRFFFLHVCKCEFKRLQIAQLFENFSSAGKGFCVKMSANYKYFVWKHLITFKSERLYSFEPKTEY